MLKTLVLISFVLFGNFVQTDSCGKVGKKDSPIIEPNVNNSRAAGDFISISEINRKNPDSGVFETRGFIAKIYTCPPCPPDAQCKPCMKDNIVISEENKNLETYDLTEKELVVSTSEAKTFSKGKEYKFTIKLTDGKTTAADLNDIKLIGYKIIE